MDTRPGFWDRMRGQVYVRSRPGTGTASHPYLFVFARVLPCLRGYTPYVPFPTLTPYSLHPSLPTLLTLSPSPELIRCVVTAFLSGRARSQPQTHTTHVDLSFYAFFRHRSDRSPSSLPHPASHKLFSTSGSVSTPRVIPMFTPVIK